MSDIILLQGTKDDVWPSLPLPFLIKKIPAAPSKVRVHSKGAIQDERVAAYKLFLPLALLSKD